MNKRLLISVALIILVIAAVAWLGPWTKSNVLSTSTAKSVTSTSLVSTPSTTPTFTVAELAKHNTATDCYIAYKGQVFDITWFIPQRAGGAQIAQECGQVADSFSDIHPGGPFTRAAVQMVLQKSVVGTLQ